MSIPQTTQTYATIPTITKSGTHNFLLNVDNIIRKAYKKIGVRVPTAEEYQDAIMEFNLVLQELQNTGVQLWKQQDAIVPLVANQPQYYLDTLLVDSSDWFFRRDGQDVCIDPITRTNYAEQSIKATSGDPNRVFVDWRLQQPVATFYPVYAATTGFLLGTDGNSYLCTMSHASAATNRPITGVDYADYWELSTATAINSWVTATDYDSGCVHYTSYIRSEDLTDAAENPDAPVKWGYALIYLLADGLAPEQSLQEWERVDIKKRAMDLLSSARAGNRESADLRIFPDFGE